MVDSVEETTNAPIERPVHLLRGQSLVRILFVVLRDREGIEKERKGSTGTEMTDVLG